MALLERAKELLVPNDPLEVPPGIQNRIQRGRERIDEDRAKVNECLSFWRGDQYCYVNEQNKLVQQSTVTSVDGSGKPAWRVRNTWNLIRKVVRGKVSAATQRVPAYEIGPSTTDPEDAAAASLGGKVARYGYDKWRVRRTTVKVVTWAIVGREGYAMPYFDPDVAPYVEDPETGEWIGQGEVKIRTFGPNEVGHETGVDFEESRWFFVQQARQPSEVMAMPGYLGGKLVPDANNSQNETDKPKLVMVTEYFERPSAAKPEGCRYIIANNRQICPKEPYPAQDPDGNVVDEPVLHRLSYDIDPDGDHDRSLVEILLDPVRTYNDSHNKITEWKNRALNPQMKAPVGSMKGRRTDEPGVVNYYTPVGGKEPEWEQVPGIPRELFDLLEVSKQTVYDLADSNEIPSQVEAAKAIQAVIERDQLAWQHFIADLAEWHSRLMRHCLSLVAQHYSEPRLLKIRGRFGPEVIEGFTSADLRNQIDVTVLPGSIEPRTKQGTLQFVQWIAQTFPGYLSPEAAIAAAEGGAAERLIQSYELDVSRVHQIIQRMKEGPDVIFAEPLMDPMQPPSWAPRDMDNLAVHKAIFGDWMKTTEYDMAALPVKEAARIYWDCLEWLEGARAVKQAQREAALATQLGMTNAATPPGGQMPSQPGVSVAPKADLPIRAGQ